MNDRIFYISTNNKLKTDQSTKPVTFREALFMGLAPDGGLFVPTRIPTMSEKDIMSLKGKPYSEVAYHILKRFLHHDLDEDCLKAITKDVYNFDVPIEKLDSTTYLVRLDRGPTASFKDFGARFMARVMQELKPADLEITILVATSGDTGSAVGHAYRELDQFKVFILYPELEVSSIQKRQLDSIGGNVRALAINGKFDDCQRLVKQAFSDPGLAELNLTSANSINIGRLLPQVVYYFYAFVNIVDNFETVVFSVPSGNLGNSLGGEYAKWMGLPIEKLILAVNENDEVPRFLNSGKYEKIEPSRKCLSNAMNVGNPSNLARFFDFYGGMLSKDGVVLKDPDMEEMKKHLFSVSIGDSETVKTIKKIFQEYHTVVEPHGAVGLAALQKYRETHPNRLSICLETADPAKFPKIIERELGISPNLPPSFKEVFQQEIQVDHLENNFSTFKSYLMENV